MSKPTKRPLPTDGFHWEEWRDGVLVQSGFHNGSTLAGTDASFDSRAPAVIAAEDFEKIYSQS